MNCSYVTILGVSVTAVAVIAKLIMSSFKTCNKEGMREGRMEHEATMKSHTISLVEYSTVQHSTVQHSIVQYSTVQYSTVQYSTVQHSTCSTVHRSHLILRFHIGSFLYLIFNNFFMIVLNSEK